MKNLFILVSLILYIFGSSYAVHATTMILPYMQNNMVDMTTCHNDNLNTSTNAENSSCLDRCVWIYWEISSSVEFENLEVINFDYNLINFDYNIWNNIFEVKNILKKEEIPPDKTILYPGYVGKVTILII